jgi:hypothetical protein
MSGTRANNACNSISLGKKFAVGLGFAIVGPAVAALLSAFEVCIRNGCQAGDPENMEAALGMLSFSYVLGAIPSIMTVVLSAFLLGHVRAWWLAVVVCAFVGSASSVSYYVFAPLLHGVPFSQLLASGFEMPVRIGLFGLAASLVCSTVVVTYIRPILARGAGP